MGNDQDRLSASGVPGLRADLELFLTAGKTRLFLDNVAGSAARLVSAQRQDLPDLVLRMPGLSIPMELPRRLPRKASPGAPRIGRYLTDALTAFEEQARAQCAEAAADWAARLEDQADRQLTAAAEWFRHPRLPWRGDSGPGHSQR